MYGVIITIHVIVSLFLIAVILLQAGRGGGLADSFGGSQMQNLFGTKSTTVLTKLTTICATLFVITCLTLAILSGYRSRSLIENIRLPEAVMPVQPETAQSPEIPAAPVFEEVTPATTETQGGADQAS